MIVSPGCWAIFQQWPFPGVSYRFGEGEAEALADVLRARGVEGVTVVRLAQWAKA